MLALAKTDILIVPNLAVLLIGYPIERLAGKGEEIGLDGLEAVRVYPERDLLKGDAGIVSRQAESQGRSIIDGICLLLLDGVIPRERNARRLSSPKTVVVPAETLSGWLGMRLGPQKKLHDLSPLQRSLFWMVK